MDHQLRELVFMWYSLVFKKSTFKLRKKKSYDGLSLRLLLGLPTKMYGVQVTRASSWAAAARADEFRVRQQTQKQLPAVCQASSIPVEFKSLLWNANFMVPKKGLKCSFPSLTFCHSSKQYSFD